MPVDNSITFRNARILFRNFVGNETPYNRKGARNFCVVIPDEETAQALEKDGWNVKRRPPREEGDTELIYLKVNVSYKGRPPKIVMITSRGRNEIGEDLVSMLDFADMKLVDLIVNPYNWEVRGETGVSAYLKTMYVTINEDELELAYAEGEEPF